MQSAPPAGIGREDPTPRATTLSNNVTMIMARTAPSGIMRVHRRMRARLYRYRARKGGPADGPAIRARGVRSEIVIFQERCFAMLTWEVAWCLYDLVGAVLWRAGRLH
jgi:hypothetical protein